MFEFVKKRIHAGSLFRTFNSYSLNFNSGLCNRHNGFCLRRTPSSGSEQFLWFWDNDLLQFHYIFLLFDSSKPVYLVVLNNDTYS